MNQPIAKKSLGQHWLNDPGALEAVCDAADISRGDVVLEIGPGTGNLTRYLLDACAKVIAVEKDESLAASLPATLFDSSSNHASNPCYSIKNLCLINQDILRFDWGVLPAGYKLVANIPYYLTGHLLRLITQVTNKPAKVAILVQKEVAERIAAKPGEMSVISVSAQLYYQVELGIIVPAKLFIPAPKVDSQILILTRRELPIFPRLDAKKFLHVVKAGFSNRRKTLSNSLAGGMRISKGSITAKLKQIGIDANRRPQELSLDEWYRIYSSFADEKG